MLALFKHTIKWSTLDLTVIMNPYICYVYKLYKLLVLNRNWCLYVLLKVALMSVFITRWLSPLRCVYSPALPPRSPISSPLTPFFISSLATAGVAPLSRKCTRDGRIILRLLRTINFIGKKLPSEDDPEEKNCAFSRRNINRYLFCAGYRWAKRVSLLNIIAVQLPRRSVSHANRQTGR